MSKQDWLYKLGSKKLWALAAVLVTNICILFGVEPHVYVQLSAVITSFGAVVTYLIVEAHVDATRMETTASVQSAQLDMDGTVDDLLEHINSLQTAHDQSIDRTISTICDNLERATTSVSTTDSSI